MGRAIGECQGCWICGQLSRALSFEKPDTHGVFATRQYDQLLIPMLHINTVSAPKTVDATTHHTSLARKCAASGNESLDSPVCMSRDRGTRTAALGPTPYPMQLAAYTGTRVQGQRRPHGGTRAYTVSHAAINDSDFRDSHRTLVKPPNVCL